MPNPRRSHASRRATQLREGLYTNRRHKPRNTVGYPIIPPTWVHGQYKRFQVFVLANRQGYFVLLMYITYIAASCWALGINSNLISRMPREQSTYLLSSLKIHHRSSIIPLPFHITKSIHTPVHTSFATTSYINQDPPPRSISNADPFTDELTWHT